MTRTLAVALALLIVSVSAPLRAITMEGYLARVRATHPLFDRERMERDIAERRSTRYLGAQDWSLESGAAFQHVEPLQVTPFDPERIDNVLVDAGGGRAFWGTGSRLSVGWRFDATDQNLPGFIIPGPGGGIEVPVGPSTYYRNMLSATWSLPLLRNRGGALDRLEYELSGYDIDLSDVTAIERQEDFVLDVALRFVRWALLEEQRRIAADRLALAEEELDRTRRQRAARLVDEADVLRAQSAVHLTQAVLRNIEAAWESARAALAVLASSDEALGEGPDFDLYEIPAEIPGAAEMEGALVRSRLVRAIDIQRRQLSRLEAGNAEVARPELALNLSGALLGGDEAMGASFALDHPDIGVGLELRYPIGNRTAEADLATTRLELRQLAYARGDVEVSLRAGMEGIITQLEGLDEVLALDVQRIETARRKTEEEQLLYERGRGNLTFVIQSRDEEAIARLDYAENAARFHELVLQYRALADELLSDAEAR
jgi:outer membrane protein TolC